MSNIKGNITARHNNPLSLVDMLLWVADVSLFRGELMGIAIIWVMLLHGSELYQKVNLPVLSAIMRRGNLGVDIFLYLSGFGLNFSLKNNADIKEFYLRRIKRVFIPYLLLSTPFWVYNTLRLKETAVFFLRDITGISFVQNGVVTTWYVFLILFLYIIYPFVFRFEERKGAGADVCLIVMSVVLCLLVHWINVDIYHNIEIAITRIPAFLIGSASARLLKQKRSHDYILFDIYVVVTTVLFIASPFINRRDHELGVVLYRFGGAGVCMILMGLICQLFKMINGKPLILKKIGALSFELYLIHIFLRRGLATYYIGVGMIPLLQCLIWTGCMLLSFLLSYLFHSVYQFVISSVEAKTSRRG